LRKEICKLDNDISILQEKNKQLIKTPIVKTAERKHRTFEKPIRTVKKDVWTKKEKKLYITPQERIDNNIPDDTIVQEKHQPRKTFNSFAGLEIEE